MECLEQRLLLTFDIEIDYRFDTSGFFNPQARRDVLEQVAATFESRINDTLDAITPSGGNTWNAVINHPSTGNQFSISNLVVPADTVVIFVGARDLPSGLGLGGPGGFSASGSSNFVSGVETRGEAGVVPNGSNDTDFAPWGGSISFDKTETWNFSTDPPVSGQNDFYSVAVHEMAHVLGFGTSDSFRRLINGANQFTGAASVATNGSPVPMHADSNGNPDAGHWATNTTSTLPGTVTIQETSMDPQITTGSRKDFTDLDWAGLDDLGWEVSAVADPVDFGDAPDATAGTSTGNYNTRAADNGPSHNVIAGLFIGNSSPDGDDGGLQNSTAVADDQAGSSDEGFNGSDALSLVAGTAGSIRVNVTNTTGAVATLSGWVDFNQDGVFSTAERAQSSVPAGTSNGTVTLNFSAAASSSAASGSTFARFRLSTNAAAAGSPTGAAPDGEVEDHRVAIVTNTTTTFDTLPSFNWPSTLGAVRYELEVTDVTNGGVIILQSHLTKTHYRPEHSLVPATYAWRYRAHTALGPQLYSDPQQFTVQEKNGTPEITDPAALNAETGAASRPTFAWSAIGGATRYHLWVDDLTRNISRLINQTDLSRTSFTPSTALPAGNYRAWVRPFNDTTSLSGWSAPFEFTVSAGAAAAGEVTSPVGTSPNAAPVIAWRPISGTQRLIVTDTVTGNTVVDVNNVQGLSYTPPNGLPPGSYSARIEVDGTPAAGGPSTFQIQETTAGGAAFTNIQSDETNPVPVLGWTAVTNATRYEIWVDDLTRGTSRFIFDNSITGTAYQATQPFVPGNYRAWIRARSESGPIGNWSTPVTFRVTAATTTPTIWAPINHSVNTLPTIAWSAVQDASLYTVTVRLGGNIVAELTSATSSINLNQVLEPGSYSVTVTAIGRPGQNSDTADFEIGTVQNSIRLLNVAGTTTNTRPTFTWPQVDGATRYVIWVNDETRNIVASVFDSEIRTTVFTPEQALLPGDYRVWVRAFDASSALTSWSVAAPLFVAETDGPPQITAPDRSSTNPVPDFTWTAVTGAASYQVQVVDTGVAGHPVVYSADNITATVHRPTQTLAHGSYAVRVRSVDGQGTSSAFSADYAFDIVPNDPADVLSVVAPLERSTVSGTEVLFAWTTPATPNVRYELWVNNLTEGRRAIYETALTDNSFTATALPAGSYRLWVRAVGAGVNQTWSAGRNFEVS